MANRVRGNNSFGIAVSSYCVAMGLSQAECDALDIEPNADGNRVLNNSVKGNGTAPDPALPAIFAVDLAWDTTGTGNCWSKNKAVTTFPSSLPACS